MFRTIKKELKGTIVHLWYLIWKTKAVNRREYRKWAQRIPGSRIPHAVKCSNLLEQARRYGATVLVETGTHIGETVDAMRPMFKKIYSIELSEFFYSMARLRFRSYQHIELLHGDSGELLHQVMPKLNERAIFWLDGHYSAGRTARGEKETPILQELGCILAAIDLGHVLMIDDARCYVGVGDYPTIEELTHFLNTKRPGLRIDIADDCIRVVPAT